MKRIKEINVNTSEYWDKFSTDAYQAADLRRGGNLCKFTAVKELINENSNILDIGCLNGNFYNFLKENNFKIKSFTGIDLSEKLIERAKNRFPEQKWIRSECYHLPFDDNEFDIVSLMEILEHIEEPEIALQEAKRVCKDNGIVIITVPNEMKINDGAHIWMYEINDVHNILSKIGLILNVSLICANRNILGKCIVKKIPIKLNLGCGSSRLAGYINIDIAKTPGADIIADCSDLPFEINSIDEIVSYHLIEHFDELEGRKLLEYWKSLLKPGGKLILECPNILGMVKRFLKAYEETNSPRPGYLFGCHDKTGRENIANDNHKWGYTQESIAKTLKTIGFESIIVGEGTDYHAKGFNFEPGYFIRVEAIKPIL